MFTTSHEELINIGYDKLLKENDLDYLLKLSSRLAHQQVNVKYNPFKVDKKNLEKCVTQFLIQRTLKGLIKEFLGLIENNELKIALPKQWLVYLEEEGLKRTPFQIKLGGMGLYYSGF